MFKRLSIALVLALIVIFGAGGTGSAAVTADLLRIGLWPEYDDRHVFMVQRMEYPANAPLPIEVRIALPKDATIRWAGQIMGGDVSKDIAVKPQVNEQADYDEAVFTLTQSRVAQIEANWDGLETKDQDRSLVLDWTQRYDIKQTIFEFREPSQVSDLQLSELFNQPSYSSDGSEFTETAPLSLGIGQTVTLKIAYKRSTTEPTVDKNQAAQPATTSRSSASNSGRLGVIIIVLFVAATVLVAYLAGRKQSDRGE